MFFLISKNGLKYLLKKTISRSSNGTVDNLYNCLPTGLTCSTYASSLASSGYSCANCLSSCTANNCNTPALATNCTPALATSGSSSSSIKCFAGDSVGNIAPYRQSFTDGYCAVNMK